MDFCKPGAWEATRGNIPPAVAAVRDRVAREIVHLTYHRLGITEEAKAWDYAAIFTQIASALASFASTALPTRLSRNARNAMLGLSPTINLAASQDPPPVATIGGPGTVALKPSD